MCVLGVKGGGVSGLIEHKRSDNGIFISGLTEPRTDTELCTYTHGPRQTIL